MSKPKRLAANATPDKTLQHKPLIQAEGKLTPAQLEAISAGGLNFN